MNDLRPCWEIMNCGREKGGCKVAELGECPASELGMGHSCWVVAGTFCLGEVQGTMAYKWENCMRCEVFQTYNRMTGRLAEKVKHQFPEEQMRYLQITLDNMRSGA